MGRAFWSAVFVFWLLSCCSAETCSDDGSVRLVGGPNEFEGRVEVCLEGEWARWCLEVDTLEDEATVVCRQLGHDAVRGVALRASLFYGIGTSSVLINNLDCPQTARNITECNFDMSTGVESCNDAGVACRDPACVGPENIGKLISNIAESEELVEVCSSSFDGYRAGLCCEDFTAETAAVLCRQQIQQTNSGRSNVTVGGGQRFSTVLYSCTGTEQDFSSCQLQNGPRNCQNVVFSCAGFTAEEDFMNPCLMTESTTSEFSTTTTPGENTTIAATAGNSKINTVIVALVVVCVLLVISWTIIPVLVICARRKRRNEVTLLDSMGGMSKQDIVQEVAQSSRGNGVNRIRTTKNASYSQATPVENSYSTQEHIGGKRMVISECSGHAVPCDTETQSINATKNEAYSVIRRLSNEGDYEN